jgi:hypothetical protein
MVAHAHPAASARLCAGRVAGRSRDCAVTIYYPLADMLKTLRILHFESEHASACYAPCIFCRDAGVDISRMSTEGG